MSAKQKVTFRPSVDVLEDRFLLAAGLGHGLALGHEPHGNHGLHLGQHKQHHNHGHHLGQHKDHHNNGHHNGQHK